MQLPRGGDADTINQGTVLPHYDDLFALWPRGEGVPIAWTPEEIRQATVETLELIPE